MGNFTRFISSSPIVALLLGGLALTQPSPASAAEAPMLTDYDPHDRPSEHHVIATKFAHLFVDSIDAQTHNFYGAGLMYEFELWPHALELELALEALTASNMVATPADVRLKLPLHLSTSVDLFIGAGVVIDVLTKNGHTHVYPGLASSAGAYLWTEDDLGVVLEMSYSQVDEGHTVHEFGSGAGIAYRY